MSAALSSAAVRHVGISLGNMGSLYDGLGEFAYQMGHHIAGLAPEWQQRFGVHFHIHCREKLFGSFGNEVNYIPVTRWQRLHHVQPLQFGLWHSLHQLNKTLPPQGAAVRLVTVHDLNYLYKSSAFSRWRDHRRAVALVRRTDHIVAISQYAAADVRKHLHWTGPLEVIYRGPQDLSSRTPQSLPGFAPKRPFLFHLSRMSASKNPQSMMGLAAAWPEMDFLFCGPPTAEAKALQAGNQLPNVHFSLAISEEQKAWAYANCAGFLFPSFAEGFGMPPVEAMRFGKPVFLSRLTSLPEVGGDAAYYFDDWSPQAMRQVVIDGLQRGAEPERIAYVKQYVKRFDLKAAADDYMALYLRLLKINASA